MTPAEQGEAFTISVRGPLGEHLGQNYRGHWFPRHESTAAAREAWKIAARQAWRQSRMFDQVRLTVTAYLCRKRPKEDSPDYLASKTGARPRDNDNLLAMMKPAFDGFKDAGLYPDDSADHVTHGEPRILPVSRFEEERVEVLVEPVGVQSGGKG